MMPIIEYGHTQINYLVRHSKRRQTLEIAVDPDDGVIVTCPTNTPDRQIERELLKRASWILQKLSKMNEIARKPPEREYISGESYYYLGRSYRLKVIRSKAIYPYSIKLVNGRFLVKIPPNSSDTSYELLIPDALRWWYVKHAEAKLPERVDLYASKMGLFPSGIVIKDQMKRWGSCTKDGIINLNWKIVMAPISIIDYVIVHELSHLEEPNHSKQFWNRVRSILPDYMQRKEWLRINGSTLTIS